MTDTEFSERPWDRAAGESFWPAEKLSYDDLGAEVKASLIDTVVVASVDVHGKLVGKRVPADLFLERLRDGIELASAILIYDNDWSFLEGFPEIGAQNAWSDMETVPDLTTAPVLPLGPDRDRAGRLPMAGPLSGRVFAAPDPPPPARALRGPRPDARLRGRDRVLRLRGEL
jgi:hypothetical protein